MYSLLRRRTMMMKPSVIPTERLIYQLYDYTCDGTINTFIDTGIKLFGIEYDAFRIEMEYDGLDITTHGQETLLECKAFVGSINNPGFSVRVVDSNSPYAGGKQGLNTSFNPVLTPNSGPITENTSSAILSIIYNKKTQNGTIVVNGNTYEGSGFVSMSEPLTIGGRYSSHLSNPNRFVQVHISSLKIYAVANENYQYVLTPLTFKCLTGGDLSINNTNDSYDRNFEYSLNGGAWTAFDLPKNTASKLIATLSPNDTISFRRNNENFAEAHFISDSNLTFDIYGNLLSLQYGSAFNGQTNLRNTTKKAFGGIFEKTNVVDASKLMLTAPTLSNNCYNAMFWHCTSLVSAPIIFATTLGTASCKKMFSECYSLVNVQPALYFTTLSKDCCYEMFNECNSLVNAPTLSATTLAEGCYHTMFRRCYSLTVAPELLATTMAKNCYYGMFSGCAGIVNAPELPATTLAETCYHAMFQDCTSLTTAPNLSATTLASSCYKEMFFRCTGLINAPELPATILAISCYESMFDGCTNLTIVPELLAATLVTKCYQYMFRNCSKLKYLKCLATDISATNCTSGILDHVSAEGTFVKASGVTWPSGFNGIPNGWNVIEE